MAAYLDGGDCFPRSTFLGSKSSPELSLEQESKLLTTFASPTQPSLLPRFLNYRELLTFLYHNKGVDLQPIKNLVDTYDNEALVEVIAFVLDRPIAPDEQLHLHSPLQIQNGITNPTDIKFGAFNNNFELTDLHQNALLPGHRCQERDVVDYLGLAHGCRQQSAGGLILLKYLALPILIIDMFLQWDIMRIIRSRNWMDELYLGSTFRDTVYQSPFRQYFKQLSHAVTINALSDGQFLIKLKQHLLKLTFRPATNPQYQDHINLWLGTQYNRQFQTLVNTFHPTELATVQSQLFLRDYFTYVDTIHTILFQLLKDFISCADLELYTILFNNVIPIIPLFDNAHEDYLFRKHSHHNSDDYDGTPTSPALQPNSPQHVTFEVDGRQYPIFPHQCSFRTSPLFRHVFHLFSVQNYFFTTHTLTSRILQLENDISCLIQAQEDEKQLHEKVNDSLCIKTNATLIPTYLNLEDLQYTLRLYQDMSKSAYNTCVFQLKMFGVDILTTQHIVLSYVVSKLYNKSELCELLTNISGINDDNMWNYNHLIRQKYQIDDFATIWDVFCLPLAPTSTNPTPTTLVPICASDPTLYHSEDMSDDVGQVKNKLKKKSFTPLERVNQLFRSVLNPTIITQKLLSLACTFHLDHIVSLFDTTTDYFYKTFDDIDTITHLLSSGTPCIYSDVMITNDELQPQFCTFSPTSSLNNDISWFKSKTDLSQVRPTSTSICSLVNLAVSSCRLPRLTLIKFLLSPHHGQVTFCESNLVMVDWFFDPASQLLSQGFVSYGLDIGISHKGKKNANLVALPKLTDLNNVIIVDSMGTPINSSDNGIIDHITTLEGDSISSKVGKKLQLTTAECAQYQRLSQDQINQYRQKDFSYLLRGHFPVTLLPCVLKLLILNTKNNKKLYSNVLQLSQNVIDEVLVAAADLEAAKKKQSLSNKSKTAKKNDITESKNDSIDTSTQTQTQTLPAKQLLLPRICKAKLPNLSFWSFLSSSFVATALHIPHFQSIQNFKSIINMISILFTEDFLNLTPLSMDAQVITVTPSPEPQEQHAIQSGLSILRDLFHTIHTYSSFANTLTSSFGHEIEDGFKTLLTIVLPPHNPLTRAFIRNGPMAYFDFVGKVCVKPPIPKFGLKNAATVHNTWIDNYKNHRFSFQAAFSSILIAFIRDCGKLVPNVAKWFVDEFKIDISIAFLGGDDCEDSPAMPAYLKTPTHIFRARNSSSKGAKNSSSPELLVETPPKFTPFDFVIYSLTANCFLDMVGTVFYLLPPRFSLSDCPHVPSMESILTPQDMSSRHFEIEFYSNKPHVVSNLTPILHGVYQDYIPSQFSTSCANHIVPFLPLSIRSNSSIKDVLFPYQHYNFQLPVLPLPSELQTNSPNLPTQHTSGENSIDTSTSTHIPIYTLAPFSNTISELFSTSTKPCYTSYATSTNYQFYYTPQYRAMPAQNRGIVDALEKLMQFETASNPIGIVPTTDCPSFLLRAEQYNNCIYPDIIAEWSDDAPLPPLYPWQLYSYIFHTQSTIDTGVPTGTFLNEANEEETLSLSLTHIPIIRYPRQSILSVQALSDSQSIHLQYSDDISCVGQYTAHADHWLNRFPLPIQPISTELVPFNNCPINTFNYTTNLQKGIDPEPLHFRNQQNYQHFISMVSSFFSPMAHRIGKYIDALIQLNQKTHARFKNSTLFALELFTPILSLMSPFLLTTMCDQLFSDLLDHTIDNDIDQIQPNDESNPNIDSLFILHHKTLSKRLSTAFPTIPLDAIESYFRTNIIQFVQQRRPLSMMYCPVLTQLGHYMFSIRSALAPPTPIQRNLQLFKNNLDETLPYTNTRVTWSTDLAYNGLETDDFLNIVGVFTPNEVSHIFSKWTSYLTTTTSSSHYRDGKQFTATNYIRCNTINSPTNPGDSNDDDIALCDNLDCKTDDIDSITWKFAQLRKEYLDFIFYQYNPTQLHDMTLTTSFSIQDLPQPFSNRTYHHPEHIVNRYNLFVETQLSSSSRYTPTAQVSGRDDISPMYGTRIVFDFDQFLQSPSLGSISYIPNISTKADPTTATAKITAANPPHNRFQTYPDENASQIQVQNIPDHYTASYNDRYLLDPETYSLSPITTPIYNNPSDNILNLPSQYYQSLHSIISRCNKMAEVTTVYPRAEAFLEKNHQNFTKRFDAFTTHGLQAIIRNLNSSHRVHHIISTPTFSEVAEFGPSTTTFGRVDIPLSITSSAKMFPIPVDQFIELWNATVKHTKKINLMEYPALPIWPSSYDIPKVVSTRHLMLILQQFSEQPISPTLILNYSSNTFSSPTLIANLIDILLHKTNGDLWHSWISRSFYTLGSDNSNKQFKDYIQRIKLEPIDYYYYGSPIYDLVLARGTLSKPFGDQLLQIFLLLTSKYNLTCEDAFKKLNNLSQTHSSLASNPNIWKQDPQYPRGDKLTSNDFYQPWENIHDESKKSGFFTDLMNKLNPMYSTTSSVATYTSLIAVAAAAAGYFYYANKQQLSSTNNTANNKSFSQ